MKLIIFHLPARIMPLEAVLTCWGNSHAFQERRISVEEPVKVGRSVAQSRPSSNNTIFDCKVLSRNHALIWSENGKASHFLNKWMLLFKFMRNLERYLKALWLSQLCMLNFACTSFDLTFGMCCWNCYLLSNAFLMFDAVLSSRHKEQQWHVC